MMSARRPLSVLFAGSLLAAAIAYGCSDDALSDPPELDAGTANPPPPDAGTGGGNDATPDGPVITYLAKADLAATGLADAGTVNGTVTFSETSGAVTIAVQVTGATPGNHGLHIHAGSTCDADDAGPAGAAGGHWNPTDAGHGHPDAASHHPGDLGNVAVGVDGVGKLDLVTTDFNVRPDGGVLSALGHAMIFHQGADDGTTQPTGNAGGRAGCAVIQAQ